MKTRITNSLFALTVAFGSLAEVSAQSTTDRSGHSRNPSAENGRGGQNGNGRTDDSTTPWGTPAMRDRDRDGVGDHIDQHQNSDLRTFLYIEGKKTSIPNIYDSSPMSNFDILFADSEGRTLADNVAIIIANVSGILKHGTRREYFRELWLELRPLIHSKLITRSLAIKIRRNIMYFVNPLDSDGDGVPNRRDLCPNSDLAGFVLVALDPAFPYKSDIRNQITTPEGIVARVTVDGCSLTDIIQNGFDVIFEENLSAREQSEAVREFIFELVDEGLFTREEGVDLYRGIGGISN